MPRLLPRSSGPILDYYRCLEGFPEFGVTGTLKKANEFFRFGNSVCYGNTSVDISSGTNGHLFDAAELIQRSDSKILLPFVVSQVLDNLRYERYATNSTQHRWLEKSWARNIYYQLRPMLPISFRRHLQKLYLKGWDTMDFPAWPVDRSVDKLFESLVILAMKFLQTDRIPFIWFWPKNHKACAIVTHDVETQAGRDFCDRLMDIDDSFGIKASFQIVPEKRYEVPPSYVEAIRKRGYEINVHGLDHDGDLFENRDAFLGAARKINEYARFFGSRGFRSPILYRNLDWFHELDFSYDMSVPNSARLQAQRGGCCTVMPYFLPGGMLELPLTTTEDYTLFHILGDYSTALWKQQMGMILDGNGLISFIVHPDYVIPNRAQDVYRALLEELGRLRSDRNVWVTLPGEVDRWWRERNEMRLVPDGHQHWRIEGTGSERASLAYTRLHRDTLVYEIESDR